MQGSAELNSRLRRVDKMRVGVPFHGVRTCVGLYGRTSPSEARTQCRRHRVRSPIRWFGDRRPRTERVGGRRQDPRRSRGSKSRGHDRCRRGRTGRKSTIRVRSEALGTVRAFFGGPFSIRSASGHGVFQQGQALHAMPSRLPYRLQLLQPLRAEARHALTSLRPRRAIRATTWCVQCSDLRVLVGMPRAVRSAAICSTLVTA